MRRKNILKTIDTTAPAWVPRGSRISGLNYINEKLMITIDAPVDAKGEEAWEFLFIPQDVPYNSDEWIYFDQIVLNDVWMAGYYKKAYILGSQEEAEWV